MILKSRDHPISPFPHDETLAEDHAIAGESVAISLAGGVEHHLRYVPKVFTCLFDRATLRMRSLDLLDVCDEPAVFRLDVYGRECMLHPVDVQYSFPGPDGSMDSYELLRRDSQPLSGRAHASVARYSDNGGVYVS